MGQKVNPHGMRVGVIMDWDSRWYARNEKVGDLIIEDFKIREYIKKNKYDAGISKIEIERNSHGVRVIINCARAGIIIGRGGADIEKLRATLEKIAGKPVKLDIAEIKVPDLSAQLVAENIASQLEKRISFRRAMKQCMMRATKAGAKGIKTACSGRLGGAEIARNEHYHEGTIPLQTIRADIDYGFAEACTTYGRIGVKVWIYKGEILTSGPRMSTVEIPKNDHRNDRRNDRRPNDRRDGQYGDKRQAGGFRRDNTSRDGGRPGGFRSSPPARAAKPEGGNQ